MSATIRQIVDGAQGIVGEVSGAGVQMFSDDRMFADAIRAFNMLFKKFNWRNYCNWLQLTLDGINGVVTTNELQYVIDFEDFISIRKDGAYSDISVLPRSVNPFSGSLTSGTSPQYWDSLNVTNTNYALKKIYILPKTATGKINVHAKFYPNLTGWDWQDTMHIDQDMLEYGTAYMTLVQDDLNAAGADAAKGMMEMRYKDIQDQLASQEIKFGGGRSGVPSTWQEV
jgi:hypothetical protein